jgi:hypothetical protein
LAKKSGSTPGDVVRFVPAPEPMVAAISIGLLTLVEVTFALAFLVVLFASDNSVEAQQVEALLLGGALLTLAAILSLYRKFFLPDVMIVKKRKLKYEDLM